MWQYSSLVLTGTAQHSHFPEPDYPRSQMKPGSCFRAGPAALSVHPWGLAPLFYPFRPGGSENPLPGLES